jgi:hypothetical protein
MSDPPAAPATTVDAADEASRQAVTRELDDTVDDLTAAVVRSVNQSGLTGRALSPFESIHALVCETTVMAIRLVGTLDPNALTAAWEGLVRENPVLAGRIEFGAEGLYLAVDAGAVTPPTTGRVNPADMTTTPIAFGQPVAGLDVTPCADGGHWVSLLTHHSIADGILMYHWFSALWQKYTRGVGGAPNPPPDPLPIPAAPESLLAERGVAKGTRTGAERLDGIVVYPFRDPVGRAPGDDPFALHRIVTVFGVDETVARPGADPAPTEPAGRLDDENAPTRRV